MSIGCRIGPAIPDSRKDKWSLEQLSRNGKSSVDFQTKHLTRPRYSESGGFFETPLESQAEIWGWFILCNRTFCHSIYSNDVFLMQLITIGRCLKRANLPLSYKNL